MGNRKFLKKLLSTNNNLSICKIKANRKILDVSALEYWSDGLRLVEPTARREYWSVKKKDINPLVITPTLQYSNSPKLIEIESYYDGLPSFGL
jgi:hypothetical protein